MAYSELIKNFDRIREYMRQFYVYGFKSRTEYHQKSARSYDNERRRIESWLGDYMGFRQTSEGKNVFLSVDSRAIPGNPLYNAFKAKSFTTGDVTFHFYVLDLLGDGSAYTAGQILDQLWDNYLCFFENEWQPDLSTVRKKLKEYVQLGLLETRKQGRELLYRLPEKTVDLEKWGDILGFFSEADPLGIIGSTLLDKLPEVADCYRFKHHYILYALDSQILLQLLRAIAEGHRVMLCNLNPRYANETEHKVFPMKIFTSAQGGRQYLLCWHYEDRKLMFFRLDYIRSVKDVGTEADPQPLRGKLADFLPFCWGVSVGTSRSLEHLEMTVTYTDAESHIPKRLEREKRNGTVEHLDANTSRYSVDVYDARDMLPWIRTFIGRITELKCSNESVVTRFYEDLEQMYSLYGGEG